jgi:hypothetical protein
MGYYIPKNQVKIEDFKLPMPERMNPDNLWFRYAKMILWDELDIKAELKVNYSTYKMIKVLGISLLDKTPINELLTIV